MLGKHTKGYPYRQRFVLVVDLSNDTFSRVELDPEVAKAQFGGRGLATWLWKEYSDLKKLDKDSFYSGNAIAICLGAGSDLGLDQCKGACCVTLSMQTHHLSICPFQSASLAYALSGAGYCGVVLKNRARRLTRVSVTPSGVGFTIDDEMHLMMNEEVARRCQEVSCVISIGPAGERGVPFASLAVNGKNFGRGGIGAVFGNKNLKLLSLDADEQIRPMYFDHKADELDKILQMVPVERDNLLQVADRKGWAAVEGFTYRRNPRMWGLGGMPLTKDAPVAWEVALALGANLGIYDWHKVAVLENACCSYGLDPISTGGILAWIAGAESKGLIDLNQCNETDKVKLFADIIKGIGLGKGCGSRFSQPLTVLCAEFGNKEGDFSSYGEELMPFDLRGLPCYALSVAMGDDTLVPWELFSTVHGDDTARLLLLSQSLRRLTESLGMEWNQLLRILAKHYPGKGHLKRNRLLQGLALCCSCCEGYEWSIADLLAFGQRILLQEFELMQSLSGGFKPSNDSIPQYFQVEGESACKDGKLVHLGGVLDEYLFLLKHITVLPWAR